MFVGFPSETPDELFDTMQFIYDNQEYIQVVHSGRFALCKGTEIFLNPEKFDIEIEHTGLSSPEYKVKYKRGTTGEKAPEYYHHYLVSFLDHVAISPSFGRLRDHALLRYVKIPLEHDLKVRKKIPQPVRPTVLRHFNYTV
jgi:hypothetical protein